MRCCRLGQVRCLTVVAVVLTSGCITGPDSERVIGTVDTSRPSFFVTPDVVTAGQASTVQVTTTLGGCDRPGEAEVAVTATTATVTPYDIRDAKGRNCAAVLVYFDHSAVITFSAVGDATIVLQARDESGQPIEVSRSVVVQ